MKIRTFSVACIVAFSYFSQVFAGCVGPVINGQCTTGVYLQGHGDDDGYKGSSGQRYQYDLNNPVERNRYNIDLDAQRRDQMNQYNTDRSRDRLQGQRGGGVWPE